MIIINTEFTISYPSSFYDIFDSVNLSCFLSPYSSLAVEGQKEEFISIQTTPPTIA